MEIIFGSGVSLASGRWICFNLCADDLGSFLISIAPLLEYLSDWFLGVGLLDLFRYWGMGCVLSI